MASFMVGRVRFGSWTCPISRLDVSDGFFGHAKVLNIFGICKGMGVKKSAVFGENNGCFCEIQTKIAKNQTFLAQNSKKIAE